MCEYSQSIFEIWDVLIAQKWKGLYKVILVFFAYFEKIVVQMKFEQILAFLNNIVKYDLYQKNSDFMPKDINIPVDLLS